MGFGGQLQVGADYHIADGFSLSLFGGFQMATADSFKGKVTSGNASANGQWMMVPLDAGLVLDFIQDGQTAPTGSRPFKMDLSGPFGGLLLSAFF